MLSQGSLVVRLAVSPRVGALCARITLAGLVLPFGQAAFGASDAVSGTAGLTARASIDIAVQVPRVMQMRLLGHPAALDVTAEDIARGSITVSGPSIDLLVNDRSGYNLRAEIVNAVFTAVRIAGLPASVQVSASPAVVRMPTMVGRPRPQPMAVAYELQLASDTQPGRYAWPVALSLQEP
ncbi:MAG: hypothetical protein ACXWF0_05115 [Usitatibacter sp.]